ncbi:MAG TPA: hypothetical protein VLI39_15785 [Sedimentisphaerales bacterium]|nr:hypothetical protein [Sedimentisphaerales bacterium]
MGKSPVSSGYYLGIESVRLRERRPRVVEYNHVPTEDWRTKPTLYQ